MEEPRPASSPLHSSSTSLAGWSGDCAWFPSSALRGHSSIRQFASEPASLPVTQWSTAPRVAGGSSSRLEFHTQQRAWSGSVRRWSQQQQRLKTRTSGRGRAHSSVHASLARPLKKRLKKKKKKDVRRGVPLPLRVCRPDPSYQTRLSTRLKGGGIVVIRLTKRPLLHSPRPCAVL